MLGLAVVVAVTVVWLSRSSESGVAVGGGGAGGAREPGAADATGASVVGRTSVRATAPVSIAGNTATEAALFIRDLADGHPVQAGIAVTLQLAGGESLAVSTDAQGRVCWSGSTSDVVGAVAESAGAEIVFDAQMLESRSELWWLRRTEIRGRVGFEGLAREAETPATRLHAHLTGDGVPGAGTSAPPWEPTWLARHGVRTPPAQECGADGTYVINVPRVRGLTLTAVARGYRPMDWTVPVEQPIQAFEKSFLLRPAPWFRGRVTDETGAPVAGAFVNVYMTRRTTSGGIDRERIGALYPDGGVSSAFLSARNETLVTVRDTVMADDHGRFELPARGEGTGFLFVAADEFAPATLEFGAADGDRDMLHIQMARPSHGIDRVELRVGGKPVPRHDVVVADVTRDGAQPALDLQTDDAGTLSAHILVAGRSYLFTVFNRVDRGSASDTPSFMGRMGMLRWTGARVIDLAELTTNRDEIK